MMSRLFNFLLSQLRSLFRLEPISHARWEHLIFRLALAYLLIDNVLGMRLNYDWAFPFVQIAKDGPKYFTLPSPSGIGQIWPGITALSDPAVFGTVRICFYAAVILYVCGLFAPLALLYMLLVECCMGSLLASQGAIGHSRQTMALGLLGITLASYVCLFIKKRGGWRNLLRWSQDAQDLAMNWGRQMIVSAYAVSAVTKEIKTDGFWFTKSEGFSLAVAKAQEEATIKGVVEISRNAQDFLVWMTLHPSVSGAMLLGAWLLEISAPLMLLNRRMALLIGILLWIFHGINGWFMGLGFPLNRALLLVLFINIPWWIYAAFKPRSPATTPPAA
jgi:hypothetical protein